MCGDDVWDGWMVYGLKLEKTYKILMNLHRKTTEDRPFSPTLAYHLPQSNKQIIWWEPVASTNHTNNYSVGVEPEYDYQANGWED
jgi:hypothetical protein